MVQPHQPAVDADGELKLVFLGGEYSHAVRVGALLEPGVGVLDRPWERPVSTALDVPDARELEVARRALEPFGDLAYARVDLVAGLVLEVELIDPMLFLRLEPEAADRLAGAIVERLC